MHCSNKMSLIVNKLCSQYVNSTSILRTTFSFSNIRPHVTQNTMLSAFLYAYARNLSSIVKTFVMCLLCYDRFCFVSAVIWSKLPTDDRLCGKVYFDYVYFFKRSLLPNYFRDMFTLASQIHSYNTRNSNLSIYLIVELIFEILNSVSRSYVFQLAKS